MGHLSRLLAAGSFGLLLTGTAFAADLPSRRAPAPYVPVPPVFTWTGFYIGANAGGGSGDFTTSNIGLTAGSQTALAAGTRPVSIKNDTSGVVAGGQIGYNYQFGNIVVGAEADIDYTDFEKTQNVSGATGLRAGVRNHLRYLGTVRGRLGYAFDRILIYGTGGFAYGDVYSRETFYDAAGIGTFNGSRSDTKTGWAAGGGIEYALPTDSFLNFFHSSAVTLRAEYLHYDLGSKPTTLFSVASGAATYTGRTKMDGDIGRFGISYKF